MQYLSDGGSPRVTAIRVWFVQLVPAANMANVAQASHDTICAHDAADASGAEDGRWALQSRRTLGTLSSLSPREWNEKLAQDMTRAWEIDVRVSLQSQALGSLR